MIDEPTNYQKGLFAVGLPEDLEASEVVAHNFPEGAGWSFVLDKLHRTDGTEPVRTHLKLGEWWRQLQSTELIAILCVSGHHHLFSTMSHMYGGFIHDELGLGGWHIHPGTGAIHQVGLSIALDQWGYLDVLVRRLHPDEYLRMYLAHAKDNGVALRVGGWRSSDRNALSDLISTKLAEQEGVSGIQP